MADDYQQVTVESREAWHDWLAEHHDSAPGVWLVNMAPSGMAAVEAAKANVAWTALDEVENLSEPDDLRAALEGSSDARRNWDAFPRSTKRAILEWIAAARKPTTREGRINETARLAAQNIRANQWRQPQGAAPAGSATKSVP